MIFVLPIRTSIRPWRTPYMNYALIAINIFIFSLGFFSPFSHEQLIEIFMLTPVRPHTWQFVSYAFLHSGFMHLFGNMFFLYLFGNNVNDKLGNVGYLSFYLAGAVFSAIGHSLIRSSPVVGASGAIAAVTGAYLVLFPQTLVTVFYWFIYFIDTFEVSALYFIAFKLIFWDNVVERQIARVAYDAHLCGYAFGILSTLALLAIGLLGHSPFDLWAMIKRWNQRRIYRDVGAGGYDPFTGQRVMKTAPAEEVKLTAEQQETQEKIRRLRDAISSRILERNLAAAATLYLELIRLDSSQILPRQQLLDIANQLVSEGKHAEAAQAYESFLAAYGNYEYSEQIKLMLGLLYSRYLNNPQLALKQLEAAAGRLMDPGQSKMCREEIAKLRGGQ
jgi:membrane associated rhomboid family serine protease